MAIHVFCNVTVTLNFDLRPANSNQFILEYRWMSVPNLKKNSLKALRYPISKNGMDIRTDEQTEGIMLPAMARRHKNNIHKQMTRKTHDTEHEKV